MIIGDELRAKIIADGAVSALVAQRVYPNILPQGPTYPAIVYSQISGVRLHHLGGTSGRANPRFSYHCWGATYASARAVANALRSLLDGFNGTLTTAHATIMIESELDDYDDTAQKHRVIQDYFVNYLET